MQILSVTIVLMALCLEGACLDPGDFNVFRYSTLIVHGAFSVRPRYSLKTTTTRYNGGLSTRLSQSFHGSVSHRADLPAGFPSHVRICTRE